MKPNILAIRITIFLNSKDVFLYFHNSFQSQWFNHYLERILILNLSNAVLDKYSDLPSHLHFAQFGHVCIPPCWYKNSLLCPDLEDWSQIQLRPEYVLHRPHNQREVMDWNKNPVTKIDAKGNVNQVIQSSKCNLHPFFIPFKHHKWVAKD